MSSRCDHCHSRVDPTATNCHVCGRGLSPHGEGRTKTFILPETPDRTGEWDGDGSTRKSGPSPAFQPTPQTPETIGRFRVVGGLGEGAFGTVYLAEDPDLDRRVALKVPRVEQFASAAAVDRFIAEARHAASLKHPGIVTVHDVFRDGDGVVVVLEYVEGATLGERLDAGRPSPEEAASLVAEAARAVAHAHRQGVVHRDLKPDNILLDSEGRPHVTDFGLALHEMEQRLHKGETSGTPRYMAPEQVRGEVHLLDGRADIWSLGVILYRMLADRMPFTGRTMPEVFDEIEHREPRPPRQIDPAIPKELERICLKCLAKSPTDRYATAGDLADDLDNWRAGPTGPRPKARSRWPIGVGVAAAVLLVGVVGLWLAGVIFRVETPDGTVELELPEGGGEVFVDGERAVVVTTADGRTFLITVPPGEHRLSVKTKDGVEMFTEEFTARSGKTTVLKAAYKPKEEPAPPKRDLPDDPNILTVAQDGSARFRSIGEALREAKAGMTVRVVDDAEYTESLTLSSRSRHNGLTLEATGGATLVMKTEGRGITMVDVSGVTVRGFTMRAEAYPCWLCLVTQECSGIVIEGMRFEGTTSQPCFGVSLEDIRPDPTEPPVIVRNCRFDRMHIGVRIGGVDNDYKTPNPCRRLIIADNTFTDNFQAIRLSGEVRDVAVVGNRMLNAEAAGIQLENLLPGSGGIRIANNTMFECAGSFRLWDDAVKGVGIRLVNNLTLDPAGPDWVFIDSGGDRHRSRGPGVGSAVTETWHLSHNWREGEPPADGEPGEPGVIPPGQTDILEGTIDVLSRERESEDFLRPAKDSPLAAGGAGGDDKTLPKYVGAVPPEGTEAWDWSKAIPPELD